MFCAATSLLGGWTEVRKQKSAGGRWAQARRIVRGLNDAQSRLALEAVLSGIRPARAVLVARTWFRSDVPWAKGQVFMELAKEVADGRRG